MPYDPDNTILKGILQTSVSIVGGFAIRAVLFEPPVAVGLAATGVFFSALVSFGYVSDFQTVCEKAVNVRIDKLSKRKIKQILVERYATTIKQKREGSLGKNESQIRQTHRNTKRKRNRKYY